MAVKAEDLRVGQVVEARNIYSGPGARLVPSGYILVEEVYTLLGEIRVAGRLVTRKGMRDGRLRAYHLPVGHTREAAAEIHKIISIVHQPEEEI